MGIRCDTAKRQGNHQTLLKEGDTSPARGYLQTYYAFDDFDIDVTERVVDFLDMTDPETILTVMYNEAFRRAENRRVREYVS